jgi:hypothetical protein
MTTTTIIDAEGKVWDGLSSSLRTKLGYPLAGPLLLDLAVKNKGFVVLRRLGPRSLEIRQRPSLVKPIALLTAVQWLTDHDWDRIVLTSWLDRWQTSLMGDLSDAVHYLMGLVAAGQSTRQRDFEAHRHDPSIIATDQAFARIQDAWRARRGLNDRGLIEVVTEASCGRFLEVVPHNDASRLVLGTVGNGYSLYGQAWKSLAVGGRFEDMPDYEYAQWAARGYRDVFRTGKPIFEDITAIIQLHQSGRMRLTYRRVILPIGDSEHPARLLGATLDQRVTHLVQ